MFAELHESSFHRGKTRKPWAVTVSAIVQAALLIVLVLVPLIYTQALPPRLLTTFLVKPPPPPPALAAKTLPPVHHLLRNNQLTAPAVIPRHVEIVREEAAPALSGLSIPGGMGDSSTDLLNSLLSTGSDRAIAPPAPKPMRRSPVVVGGNVQEARIVRRVTPLYPPIARTAHVSGTVVLRAIISKDGSIEELQFVSGPPLLVKAAMGAVREWKYSPTLLNGEPVEVETTISVIFSLGD